MSRKSHALTGLGAVVVLAAALSGCAGGSAPSTAASPIASGPADGSAPVANGVAQVKVTLTGGEGGDKCTADYLTAPAGPVTFTVENVSSTAITEVELQSELKILGEKENLAPGLPAAGFTVTLDGGQYTMEHTAGVYVIDADGRFVRLLRMEEPREERMRLLKDVTS